MPAIPPDKRMRAFHGRDPEPETVAWVTVTLDDDPSSPRVGVIAEPPLKNVTPDKPTPELVEKARAVAAAMAEDARTPDERRIATMFGRFLDSYEAGEVDPEDSAGEALRKSATPGQRRKS